MHSLIPEEAVGADVSCTLPIMNIRQGSNELDRSCSRARSSPVMLSAAKHLAADRDRSCAEFTLSEANGLRVTRVTRHTVKDSSSPLHLA